ncbi:MAG: RNA polymerase-binding protein DksA [Mariprofundaceae bacterium]
MALTAKQLKEFEKQLVDWRQELEGSLNQGLQSMHDEAAGSFPDPTDQASMETDRNFDLRLRDREHKLIKKLDQALARLSDETFGICDGCEGDIGLKRLQARPVTTLCIECKTAQEVEERTRVD